MHRTTKGLRRQMKCNMLLCDKAVGQVPRQGAVVGQWVAIGVKTRGCRKIAEPRQGGCHEDKGWLRAVMRSYEMCTAHAHMAAPVCTGSHWHREHIFST